MLIRLDEASSATFAEQIAGQVRLGVARGEIRRGERLPSARDLAASLGINMHTVLRAYDDLRTSGVIDLRRGRGAVVVGGDLDAVARVLAAATDLVRDARAAGLDSAELAAIIKGMP